MNMRLLPLLLLIAAKPSMAGRCVADATPALLDARFTSAIQGQEPADRLLYLPASARELFVHVRTRGAGTLQYRWHIEGARGIDADANVGDGEWRTWSRLRLAHPPPAGLLVEIRNGDGCVLRTISLAASPLPDDATAQNAWERLEAGDATGAKIALKIALESTPAASARGRTIQRLLDVEVAIGEAEQRARAGDLFLVEPSLKQVEKRLGNKPADRSARDWIAAVRRDADAQYRRLANEGNYVALSIEHLLATEKLFYGDYPLLREDAEKIVAPALRFAGDHYTMVGWQPTLRGYHLTLQDKRTGNTLEVSPD